MRRKVYPSVAVIDEMDFATLMAECTPQLVGDTRARCAVCGRWLESTGREDRKYCGIRCINRAAYRRKHGLPIPDIAQEDMQ